MAVKISQMNLIFFTCCMKFSDSLKPFHAMLRYHIRLRLRFTMKYFPFRSIVEFALTPLGCVRARSFARSMWKMKWNSHLVLSLVGFSFSRCWNKIAAHTKSYFHFCTHAHTHTNNTHIHQHSGTGLSLVDCATQQNAKNQLCV